VAAVRYVVSPYRHQQQEETHQLTRVLLEGPICGSNDTVSTSKNDTVVLRYLQPEWITHS
jgi:hypothetical protein